MAGSMSTSILVEDTAVPTLCENLLAGKVGTSWVKTPDTPTYTAAPLTKVKEDLSKNPEVITRMD